MLVYIRWYIKWVFCVNITPNYIYTWAFVYEINVWAVSLTGGWHLFDTVLGKWPQLLHRHWLKGGKKGGGKKLTPVENFHVPKKSHMTPSKLDGCNVSALLTILDNLYWLLLKKVKSKFFSDLAVKWQLGMSSKPPNVQHPKLRLRLLSIALS